MRIAVRFRYYKAVTPSMEIVDLTDQQWREFFLLEDAAKYRREQDRKQRNTAGGGRTEK